mmetsp:Transcript_59578/g.184817  ORF Transcript_59578/g.184817 Transcript_59578/m.184817 type:complete len:167 (+) Transcript_59578:2-502(+)
MGGGKQPAGGKPLAKGGKPPKGGGKPPPLFGLGGGKQPAGGKPPAKGGKPPAKGGKPPAKGGKPPSGGKHSAGGKTAPKNPMASLFQPPKPKVLQKFDDAVVPELAAATTPTSRSAMAGPAACAVAAMFAMVGSGVMLVRRLRHQDTAGQAAILQQMDEANTEPPE